MKKIFAITYPYLTKKRAQILVYVLLCVILSILSFASPYINGQFIDLLITERNYIFLYKYCILYLALFIIKTVLGYSSNIIYTKIQMTVGYWFNVDVISHLHKIDSLVFNKMNIAYLSQQVNNDTNELVIFILSLMNSLILNVLTFIIPIYILYSLNKLITTVLLISLIFYALIYVFFKKYIYISQKNFRETQAKFFSKLNEQLRFANFIKLNSISNWFISRLEIAFSRLFTAGLKNRRLSLLFSTSNSTILILLQVFLFFVGGKAIIDGELTVGQFTIFSSFFSLMTSSTTYFSNLGKTIQEQFVAYNRLQKILTIPVHTGGIKQKESIETITIRNLDFSYDQNVVFSNFSYIFERGKLYAVFGKNGCGKTTLIKILSGMYDSDCNKNVFINDLPLSELDLDFYRKYKLSVSEQEAVFFADTITNNIFLGNDINKEDLELFCSLFNLSHINSSCNSHNFTINEQRSNLSGGEKQKFAIIRLLIQDRDIMIFDEPTSAMDEQSKKRFLEIIEKIKRNKIIIIITHDKDFQEFADETIYLKGVGVETA